MKTRATFSPWGWDDGVTPSPTLLSRLGQFRTAFLPFVLKHKSALILAAVSLVSIGGVSWSGFLTLRNQQYLEQARQGVNETFTVKLLLNEMLVLVNDLETSGRGYALTQDASYLEPLEQAQTKLPRTLVELAAVVSTEPIQSERVKLITRLAHLRLQHARDLAQLIQQGAEAASISAHAMGGKSLTDRIRQVAAQTWATEAAQFTTRSGELEDAMASARYLTWALIGAGSALLAASAILALRWRRARSLVIVCAWSKTIEYHGEWISFEEYLERRFGLLTSHGMSPEEAAKLRAQIDRS